MSLFLLLLVPFLGCAVAALLPTGARNLAAGFAALVALAVALPLALLYPQVAAGEVPVERLAWLPSLGIDLVVRIDGFAWMFAMLVSAMGVLVIVYARYYLSPDDPVARFYSLLLGFMGAMLGVVLSGHLVQLGVCAAEAAQPPSLRLYAPLPRAPSARELQLVRPHPPASLREGGSSQFDEGASPLSLR